MWTSTDAHDPTWQCGNGEAIHAHKAAGSALSLPSPAATASSPLSCLQNSLRVLLSLLLLLLMLLFIVFYLKKSGCRGQASQLDRPPGTILPSYT